MAERIDDLRLDEFARAQVQTPAFPILRRSGAGQGDQVRLGTAIQTAGLALLLLGAAHTLDPGGDKAAAHARDRVPVDACGLGNARIIRPPGSRQEDARPLPLTHRPLVRARRPLQTLAGFFVENYHVLFC